MEVSESIRGTDADRSSLIQRVRESIWAHPGFFVFVVALAVRAFIAIVLSKYFSGTLVLDDTTYHRMAADMASGDNGHWDEFTHGLYWRTATFMVPVTALYKLFGPTPLIAQLLIGVVGATAAGFVTCLAREFLETRWALVAGLIVAFLPSQAFWSSMLMKDAFVWLVLSGLAWTFVVALRSSGRKLVGVGFVAMLLLVVLSFLRVHTLVVTSWALMIAALIGWKTFGRTRVLGALALGVLVPLFFGGIGPAGLSLVTNAGSLENRRFANAEGANTAVVDVEEEDGQTTIPPDVKPEPASLVSRLEEIEQAKERARSHGKQVEAEIEQVEAEIEQVEKSGSQGDDREARAALERRERRLKRGRRRIAAWKRDLAREEKELTDRLAELEARGGGDTAPGPPAEEGSLDANLMHLPRGLSVMLVEPLPLPFEGSLSLRLARLESLLWYPILVLALVGLWAARSHLRHLALPVLAGGGIVVMYALTEGNIGTAHRHRGEFVWVVALLAALGARRLAGRRASERGHS